MVVDLGIRLCRVALGSGLDGCGNVRLIAKVGWRDFKPGVVMLASQPLYSMNTTLDAGGLSHWDLTC